MIHLKLLLIKFTFKFQILCFNHESFDLRDPTEKKSLTPPVHMLKTYHHILETQHINLIKHHP